MMDMESKPGLGDLTAACPGLSAEFLREFIERLDVSYFERFTFGDIRRHAVLIHEIRGGGVRVLTEDGTDGSTRCTVVGTDYPGVFSLITGLLSATGYSILDGDIFTYAKSESVPPRRYDRRRLEKIIERERASRKIIDTFRGKISGSRDTGAWAIRFREMLSGIYSILERGDADAPTEAKQKVYEAVASALDEQRVSASQALYPVEVRFDTSNPAQTRMIVTSEDTPFFLFSLSNAMGLHDLSIENVRIRTSGTRIEDVVGFVDSRGSAISEENRLNKITLSVLFTKQFTYFLGGAPDPYTALNRFETIIQDMRGLGSDELSERYLSDPMVLKDLARLLGTSDFLWEDFIRVQYESILPILGPAHSGRRLSHDPEECASILERELSREESVEAKIRALNAFKDREAYLIDLDHIVSAKSDFLFLSKRLTRLAELVVRAAVDISFSVYTERYGRPLGFAGIEANYAILGLGKMGGEALGYASDIELMFVYSDNGATSGSESIGNAEFFDRCFKDAAGFIEAKREGIFQVDLRLRPHGNSGPVACSLETFCNYYGPEGQSHSLERLSLVRMRAIGGDPELGARIERLRDGMIYSSESIDLEELRDIRERQLREKTVAGRQNAKFSPGGLVDLEYTVQIIQCMYGKDHPELRTPSIHRALDQLVNTGYMSGDEAKRLTEAYHFMRSLINGLRMLRGSGLYLYLPPQESDEYVHLARRMGYAPREGLRPAQILHLEFETKSAVIRNFIETHFGRDSIPGPPVGNAADLILSDELPTDLRDRILAEGGIKDVERAYRNLKSLAGDGRAKELFAKLAVLAWDILIETPDPDMALNNWERFSKVIGDKASHFEEFLSQPGRLQIILRILSGSQFLADTLIRNPSFLEWVSDPERFHGVRSRGAMEEDLAAVSDYTEGDAAWLAEIRRFRKRETLRIGARDICLGAPLSEVITELANLAEAAIRIELQRIWRGIVPESTVEETGFAILAFGKLGGRELNYSSDIDIIGMYSEERASPSFPDFGGRVLERIRADLSSYTADGFVYRVDFRLRPYGRSGPLIQSDGALLRYYETSAALWEYQALLKLRPVAGDAETASAFLEKVRASMTRRWPPSRVAASIERMRSIAADRGGSGIDVKNGRGGIRDIEFLVQGLQLIHLAEHPAIADGNTIGALGKLLCAGLLSADAERDLQTDYRFLRRLEHFLQILDDRQTHLLPGAPEAIAALARRMSGDGTPESFFDEVRDRTARVRRYYEELLLSEIDGTG